MTAAVEAQELEKVMRDFGRQRANLFAARELFNKRLMQGSGLLILDAVLLGLGAWSMICLAVALMAIWWIVQAVGLSEICDEFQDAAVAARMQLLRLLKQPGAKEQFALIFESMEGYEHRSWLAEYMPGPIELRRR